MRYAIFAWALGALPLPASASLQVGQVFVRGVESSVVADSVVTYLEALGGDAAEGRSRRNLLLVSALPGKAPSPGSAQLRGWHLLLDSTPGGVDPRLFSALSRIPGATLLRLEVDGSTLSWRHLKFRAGEGGEPPAPSQSPRQGHGAVAYEGPLPLYGDVEQEAFRWLAAQGVESALRLQGFSAFHESTAGAEAKAPGREAIAFEVRAGVPPRRRTLRLRRPPSSRGPPTRPDTVLPEGMGAPGQTVDLIRLSGRPLPRRVKRLARVLFAIQARYQRALGRPFCHLLEGAYRRPLYARLAALGGPCQQVYRTLLARIEKEATLPEAQRDR